MILMLFTHYVASPLCLCDLAAMSLHCGRAQLNQTQRSATT